MPQPTSRPARKSPPKSRPLPRSLHHPVAKPTIEVVHPLWLAKALTLSLLAALLCAWLSLCLLFYQGDWQLLLHPSPTVAQTPASLNLPFDPIRFDAAETGQPRLTAWDLPALTEPAPTAPYAAYTVLYLHDGSGSLADTLPALALLHRIGLNIFAIDYRGFGLSDASAHPTSTTMAEDSAAALTYLTATRHIPIARILPYGAGLGASLAVALAHDRPQLPAIILDNPDPDPTATALAANSSNLVPVRLLFHQHFEIAAPLSTLTTPKLLIAGGPTLIGCPRCLAPGHLGELPSAANPNPANLAAIQTLFHNAASPSYSVTLPASNPNPAYQTALIRFLDQYFPR
jgi:uncharacterized protein